MDTGTSVIWTDTPEIAAYAELFNSEQSIARVEVEYRENIGKTLLESKSHPDLVIGRQLGNAIVRNNFIALDYFFSDLVIDRNDFYPSLVKLGSKDGRQLLLPVSFNLPMMILPRGRSDKMSSSLLVSFDEIERQSGEFNRKNNGEYVAMGFSPRWNSAFLPVWAELFGSRFREGNPLDYNPESIDKTVNRFRLFSSKINSSAEEEDDFQFKYLYNPDYRSVAEGRILFAPANSLDFFILPEEKRSSLDFRWLCDGNKIPVNDDVVYLARCKRGAGKRAADEFIKWFFKVETQRKLLERSKKTRALESSFAIASGFSSLREVTEKIIPSYYPVFVGKIPSGDQLKASETLPEAWAGIKTGVIIKAISAASSPGADPAKSPGDVLASFLEDWKKSSQPNLLER